MRISDWSSDVCSSDLLRIVGLYDLCMRVGANGELALASTDGELLQFIEIVGRHAEHRSEERRVGKSVSVRVDLGGRRIIKKKKYVKIRSGTTRSQKCAHLNHKHEKRQKQGAQE